MSDFSPYQFSIITRPTKQDAKPYKKYFIDNVDTIGVYDGEEFEISLKNTSPNNIQVNLSIDGVKLLPDGFNIPVAAHGQLKVSAWPETTKKGAQLVFTFVDNGICNYVPADKFCRGLITAEVFVEGPISTPAWTYTPPIYLNYSQPVIWTISTGPTTVNYSSPYTTLTSTGGAMYTITYCNTATATATTNSATPPIAVGAGKTVDQEIPIATSTPPQTKLKHAATLLIRYMYWDQLLPMIHEANAVGLDSGEHTLMSIGKAPRLNSEHPKYERICS